MNFPFLLAMSGGGPLAAPSAEPDTHNCITKKVKTSADADDPDAEMDHQTEDVSDTIEIGFGGVSPHSPKVSYKEKLIAGEMSDSSFSPQESINLVREELIVGFSDSSLPKANPGPFNPNPVVPISLEEYDEWCRPWKYTLVVKLLGKNIGFRWMNQRIHRMWAKEGDVKVIDLTDEYYLVRFAAEKGLSPGSFWGTVDDRKPLPSGPEMEANVLRR